MVDQNSQTEDQHIESLEILSDEEKFFTHAKNVDNIICIPEFNQQENLIFNMSVSTIFNMKPKVDIKSPKVEIVRICKGSETKGLLW